MSVKPVQATKTVVTAGTRVQVNSSGPTCTSIYFEALGTNTGFIYVGLSTVSSTVYIARLSSGSGFNLSGGGGFNGIGSELDITSLYVDSSVSGEKVQVTYLTRM